MMTPEEKQILLQELCMRLPYGVRISKANVIYPMTGIDIALGYVELAVSERLLIEEARPYLRPMSSMTEEEGKQYNTLLTTGQYFKLVDYLNKKMFDYHGLIPMGLALPAPEGMYKTKEE